MPSLRATPERPAIYATGRGTGGIGDWVTLLHPPYTLWHLAYVAIGAAKVPGLVLWRLAGTLVAFFLAVGIGAHALDELNGRPLRTGIGAHGLIAAAVIGTGGAAAMGIAYGGLRLLPAVVLGVLLVCAYNLEWFGGVLHNDVGFAASWGAFPVLVGAYAQHWTLTPAAGCAAVAALLLSLGQRSLSTPARLLRRRVDLVAGTLTFHDGSVQALDRQDLLKPIERTLQALAAAVVLLAVALVLARSG